MAGRLQPLTQHDFSGGMNAVSSPYIIGPKQFANCRNLILDERGSLSTRDGYVVLTTSPEGAYPLYYVNTLTTNSGSSIDYAIQGSANDNVLYRTDTTPWTTVGSFSSAYTTPQAVIVNNQAIIAAGYEPPKVFNGSTLTSVTATAGQTRPPGAKHCAFHLGSLWVWNTNAGTTTLDGPSSLRMSDTNNVNSWPNANQTFVSKDDGQVGMGMASFTIAEFGISPTQTLVLFKNRSTYQVNGVFGASNFSVQQVKTDMGCIAPRTVQFVSGYGIIRLTHKGFALFNGVDDKIISEEVRPYILGHDHPSIIDPINDASVDRSWAVQSQNPPLYIAGCPIIGTGMTRYFVFDLISKAWTLMDFPETMSTLVLVASGNQASPTVKGGTETRGRILGLFDGASTDNGEQIDWSLTTRNYMAPSSLNNTFWRRLLMDMVFNPSQDVTFETTLFGATSSTTNTRTYRGVPVGPKWGSAVWNQFNWGGSSSVEANRDIDIMRTAPAVRFTISGSGFVKIRGLEVQARSKPLAPMRVNV